MADKFDAVAARKLCRAYVPAFAGDSLVREAALSALDALAEAEQALSQHAAKRNAVLDLLGPDYAGELSLPREKQRPLDSLVSEALAQRDDAFCAAERRIRQMEPLAYAVGKCTASEVPDSVYQAWSEPDGYRKSELVRLAAERDAAEDRAIKAERRVREREAEIARLYRQLAARTKLLDTADDAAITLWKLVEPTVTAKPIYGEATAELPRIVGLVGDQLAALEREHTDGQEELREAFTKLTEERAAFERLAAYHREACRRLGEYPTITDEGIARCREPQGEKSPWRRLADLFDGRQHWQRLDSEGRVRADVWVRPSEAVWHTYDLVGNGGENWSELDLDAARAAVEKALRRQAEPQAGKGEAGKTKGDE